MVSARNLLIYALLLGALAGSYWLADRLAPPAERAESKAPGEIDYYSVNLRRTTSDINGQRTNLLVADKLTHYQGDDHTELERPVLTLYSSEGPPWVIHGEKGTITSKGTDVFLEGPVLVEREADRNGRTVKAETSNVRVKPDEEYGETEDFVEIFSPPDELSGIGMQVHFGDALRVTVLSSVRRKHEFVERPSRKPKATKSKGSGSKSAQNR